MLFRLEKLVVTIWLVVTSFYSLVNAQSYYTKHKYRVADGLPTELVKSVQKDSLGFLWIATDEGLAKFDGRDFIHYPNALPSLYAKKIFKTSNNELLVLSDFGLTQINSNLDTTYFTQLLRGARVATDTTLLYPKSVYEDIQGDLWISEPNSMVRYRLNGKMERFNLPDKFMSDSFIRSFSPFTLYGDLWIVSINGGIFKFDTKLNTFVFDYDLENFTDITSAVPIGDSLLLVSCNQGLFKIKLQTEGWNFNRVLNILNNIGRIYIDDKQFLFAAQTTNLYRVDTVDNELKVQVIDNTYLVNEILIDKDEVWLSGDEGLQLLKRNEFESINVFDQSQSLFIESVENKDENYSYFCYKEGLYKLNKLNLSVIRIYGSESDYFLSIASDQDILWVSSGDKLYHFESDILIDEIDLSDRGDFIFNIQMDSNGDLWFTQDNVAGISKINNAHDIKIYGEKEGVNSRITVSTLDNNGILLLGGTSSNGYLYKYNNQKDIFENISHSLNLNSSKEFEVFDVVVDEQNNYWLGTSIGLIKHSLNNVEIVKIDEKFSSLSVKAIELKDNQLWFSNSFGIVRYNIIDGFYVILDESSGLPSKDISARCIKATNENTLWVGTSRGVAMYELGDEYSFTNPPFVQKLFVNGQQEPTNKSSFEFGSFIEFVVNALHFPAELVEYQYKLSSDTTWKHTDNTGRITFTDLESGDHKLLVRAKNRSSFNWSNEYLFNFNIETPWYFRWWFLTIVAIVVLMLILSGFSISSTYSKKQKIVLQEKVDQQTKELLNTNKKLTRINKELDMFVYSASHDLRAPLSSILGLTGIMKMENDPENKIEILNKIESSVARLDNFVQDVINYSKNSRLKVEITSFDPVILANDVFDSMKYNEEAKTILFEVNSEGADTEIGSDKKRLQILLNNLISNGIRYSDDNKVERYIKIHFNIGEQITISVNDNGLGIDKNHVNNIYNMFYRASETSTGSGLGLYIVYEIVSSLKGTIDIITEVGIGTEFIISIPNFSKRTNES